MLNEKPWDTWGIWRTYRRPTSPGQCLRVGRCSQSPGCLCVSNWVELVLMSSLRHIQTPKLKCLSLQVSPISCFTFKELLIFQLQETCICAPFFITKEKTQLQMEILHFFGNLFNICLSLFFRIYLIYILNMTCPFFILRLWPAQTFGKIEDGWEWGVCVSSWCLCCCSVCRQLFSLSLLMYIYVFDLKWVTKPFRASVPWPSKGSIPASLHWQPLFLLKLIFFWIWNFLYFPMRSF